MSTLAQRVSARKAASVQASRHVHAIIAEETAEATGANASLYDEFKKLLVDYEFSYKVGDKITGKVFHCDAKGAWVDIGAKAAALCPTSEASLATVKNVRRYGKTGRIPEWIEYPEESPSAAFFLPPFFAFSRASLLRGSGD